MEILVEECFGGEAFFRGEGVEFPDLGGERVSEVNFMIIGSGRRNMVCSFFSEDRRELGVFWRKDSFGFSSFCSCSKFGGGGEAGDY